MEIAINFWSNRFATVTAHDPVADLFKSLTDGSPYLGKVIIISKLVTGEWTPAAGVLILRKRFQTYCFASGTSAGNTYRVVPSKRSIIRIPPPGRPMWAML